MDQTRLHQLVGLVLSCFCLCTSVLSSLPPSGHAEEIYRYKRMWPTLPQPWYFSFPQGLAIDKQGNVYVADTGNHHIRKFTSDGQFIARWGSFGTGNGQFDRPAGITADASGNVYVADTGNHRIQKFTSDGQFIAKWGNWDSGDGQFDFPQGIAVDTSGNVYVVDQSLDRIQKFTSDGQFIAKWGSTGKGDGQFGMPSGIAVDTSGNIYVADYARIQKFTSDGQFITKWGDNGTGDGQFSASEGMAVDASGNVYITDYWNGRIQKFTSDGQFIAKWGSDGTEDGQFYRPVGIAADTSGNVYVVDTMNNRIQKFTSDGQFIAKWGSDGTGDGQFYYPGVIAVDTSGNIYVADSDNSRIQKFTSDGQFITKWVGSGTGDVQFKSIEGIAVDISGNVYVVDYGNHRIQKFTSDGQLIAKWGSAIAPPELGLFNTAGSIAVDTGGNVYVIDYYQELIQKFTSDGQLIANWKLSGKGYSSLYSIAVDTSGNVYAVDRWNHRIQKFTSDGQFIAKWGGYGTRDGKLNHPGGIAVDASGNIYVADSGNSRIQKFTSHGQFLTKWGTSGSGPDQLTGLLGVAVAQNGDVYISSNIFNRIQVFMQVPQESQSKAIIVAGGGPNAGLMSDLWNATQMCTNVAYRALNYQGFMSQNIRYLSANAGLDLDNNGVPDVFGKATNKNLKQSITEWAKDADNLIVYLSDHGGNETFVLSDARETLQAKDLASWLETLPDTRVTLVYDACKSGSFLAPLASSASAGRILIASAKPTEQAFYGNMGSLSFSNFFWTQIFNGSSLAQAFDAAEKAIRLSMVDTQHPLVEVNGNGSPNDADDLARLQGVSVTSQTSTFNSPPTIRKISATQSPDNPSKASFRAEGVTDKEKDSISRVWVVIRPPNYSSGGDGNPLNDFPYVNLARVKDSNRYEGSYGGFNTPGIYHLAFYAMDAKLNVSTPKTTRIVINSPLTHKAVLVAGWSANKDLRSAVGYNMKLAYKALRAQHYATKDIRVLSSAPNLPDVPVNSTATLEHLREAIELWAKDDTQDLVVYLVGDGQEGSFSVNRNEKLSGTDLSAWLDSFQAAQAGPGDVVVIYDACRSGSFLPLLPPAEGKRRIVISSTTEAQPALFMVGGVVSFSQFFWAQALNGATVRDAFMDAQSAINRASGKLQVPQLDDNGNGIGNEPLDFQLARLLKIGMGIASAGNAPVICGECIGLSGNTGTSGTIWAKNITTTGKIDKVVAMIITPDYQPGSPDHPVTNLPTLNLKKVGNGKYQATYKGFSTSGDYDVAVYAIDTGGNVSNPQHITVSR